MKITFVTLTIVLTVLLGKPHLTAADCPDYALFFNEINPAKKSWTDFYKYYKTYSEYCDDGVYGEVYSDFVVQSLAKYWNRFDELMSLIKKDTNFQEFILKHIDATTDSGDLKLLLKNARKRCPSTSSLFCKELEKAALSALER